MLLGTILKDLTNEADADAALAALNDLALFAQVRVRAAQYDETPGEYAAGAVSRFAAAASDEDWLALMTAIEKSNDPAKTTLDRAVRWSLVQDAKAEAPAESNCGSASCGCAGH